MDYGLMIKLQDTVDALYAFLEMYYNALISEVNQFL